MGSFRKSLVVNFLSSSGATMVQFIVSLVVARILSPAEIGIYSLAVVLVNIAHVFREFGVSTYLQRENELDVDKVRSALGVAYAIAGVVALCVYLSGGLVAAYFGYPEIRPVMHILALSFLLVPFSSVCLALLLREYDATRMSAATFAGTAAYTAACIGLALAGFGARSLAFANLANVTATGIVYVWLKPKHMAYIPRFRETGPVIRFGSGALFSNLVKSANDALPDLILGKLGTARQVGLTSRGNSTVHIFMYVAGSAMTFGSQTYLAKAYHARQPLEPLLNRAIALITGFGWPMLAVTAVAANDVIVGLYGRGWIEAAPAVLPLALMASIELMFYYNTTAFNAIGRPYLASIPLLVTAAARIGFGVALFSHSIVSFGWAMMFATTATAPVWLVLQRRYLGCGAASLARAVAPSAVVALVCGTVAAAAEAGLHRLGIASAIVRVLLLGIPTGAAWLLTLKWIAHPFFEEIEAIAGAVLPRRSAPAQAIAAE